MAFSAQWNQSGTDNDGERAPRRELRLEVHGSSAVGTARVLVRNISATGLLIESALDLPVGEVIAVDLPEAPATRAKVVWSSGVLFGCQFHTPILSSVLSAAQLQSPAGTAGMNAGATESFGLRLQRLRKEKGLTLSQIAGVLGVSKPTVWAWENGKARPVASRIEKLADLLGVPGAQLLTGREHGDINNLIAASRERIAAALGTSTDKVRIMIEL